MAFSVSVSELPSCIVRQRGTHFALPLSINRPLIVVDAFSRRRSLVGPLFTADPVSRGNVIRKLKDKIVHSEPASEIRAPIIFVVAVRLSLSWRERKKNPIMLAP